MSVKKKRIPGKDGRRAIAKTGLIALTAAALASPTFAASKTLKGKSPKQIKTEKSEPKPKSKKNHGPQTIIIGPTPSQPLLKGGSIKSN